MRVLVGCEFSGRVRDSFRARGHIATSCDLLPSETPGDHYQCDIVSWFEDFVSIGGSFDLFIAHPPCTYLANSGVRWLKLTPGRWEKMVQAVWFFQKMLDAPVPRRCIENPIMHGHARELLSTPDQIQIIQPWMWGVYETKATCLWLVNLPPLVPLYRRAEECREALGIPAGIKPKPRVHYESPGDDRWKRRSRTYQCIADEMARQWGSL